MARAIHTSIEIEAPVDQVWGLLVDLAAYPHWNPYITAADGAPQPGERLRLEMRVGTKTFRLRPVVVERAEGALLRWKGSVGPRGIFDGDHIHELSARPDGGTRYVQRERLSGVLVPLLGKTIAATEDAFDAMNRALKERAEATTRAPTGTKARGR